MEKKCFILPTKFSVLLILLCLAPDSTKFSSFCLHLFMDLGHKFILFILCLKGHYFCFEYWKLFSLGVQFRDDCLFLNTYKLSPKHFSVCMVSMSNLLSLLMSNVSFSASLYMGFLAAIYNITWWSLFMFLEIDFYWILRVWKVC